MQLRRTVLATVLVIACSGEPEGGLSPEPQIPATGDSGTAMPPDMDMPVTDSTTGGADVTSTSSTGVGGSGTSTSAGVGGTTSTSETSSTTAASSTSGTTTTTAGLDGSSTTGSTTGVGGSGVGGATNNATGGAGGTAAGGSGNVVPDGQCEVQPLSEEFRQSYDNLDPFYQKYADANGLPVISSNSPADEALTRTCLLVIDMTSARPDVHQALIENHIRFAIIGEDELTNDIPEYSYLDDSINERARGLGGTPAASCAEESILCNTDLDRWRGEGICVHEFAHTIASGGLFVADPTFQGRLQDAFENARDAGLFANTYAMENFQEYWAEGVQDWYYTNLEADPPNGIHNFVDRREELQEYDPTLYALIAEFLPDSPGFVDCYSDE